MDKPRVFLSFPRYGVNVASGAMLAFIKATRGDVDLACHVEASTSATPHTFNMAWAMALDAAAEGRVTHFAMLHSDVEAPPARNDEPGWLDILWREMKRSKADAISAVIPIKDPTPGRTSTAIGDDSDYLWYPKRFITLADRAELPETFTIDDVTQDPSERLLINTGCMLLDLRKPFWQGFSFEFKTRVVPDPSGSGRRIAQFRPEDWEMSRHVARAGGVVAATWAVPIKHHGEMVWNNQ